MKVDFEYIFKDLEGEVVLDRQLDANGHIKEGSEKPLTLRRVATQALISANDAGKITGDVKAKRYDLAMRLIKGGVQDITVEEASMLKELIGNNYAPLVVGQAYKIIEQG